MHRWFKVTLGLLFISILLAGCQKAPVTPPAATQESTPTATPAPTTAVTPSPSPRVEEPTPTTVAVESPPTATPAPLELPTIADGLQGLDIDSFFEQSYIRLVTRYPEYITTLGLSDALGVRKDRLNDMSGAYVRETQALEKAILALLKTYDRAALTLEQQLSVQKSAWYCRAASSSG